MKLSLFKCLNAVGSKTVDFQEIVRLIQYDADVQNKTESYRQIARVVSKQQADKDIKEKVVPAFSVAVLFDGNGRKSPYILSVTGLALCDIDKVDDVEDAFQKAAADPHTLLLYRTISGKGLRIIYRYCRETPSQEAGADAWQAAFLHGNRHFAELTGCDFDSQCGDLTRLSGLAHDDQLFVNMDAEPFVITDEEVVRENFSANRTILRQKGHPTGSFEVDVEMAWPKVEQALTRLQQVYKPGHHHDYVMHAAFLFNRYGTPLDDLLEWAEQQWADYDSRERERTIRSCYKMTAEHGTWKLNRPGGSRENSMITLPEIWEWLQQHVEIIYNLVTDQTMWRLLPSLSERRKGTVMDWQQVDERMTCSLRAQIAKDTGKRVLKNDVADVMRSDFAREAHPVRDYMDGLPPWDGVDRVTQLASHIRAEAVQEGQTDREAQEELCWSLHKWLVAMVATWMSDQVCNHEIFVLIGRQGLYKTTFFRFLLPPPLRYYFWENEHNCFSSKDDHIALSENCIVEIEEIDMSNPRDISELKALATAQTIKERRPYARYREEKHRLASFCGSGNQQHFLSDDTGNRRWLCVKCSHIDDPRQWELDYDQFYAQLLDEYRHGFAYWFSYEDQQRVERQNAAFCIESDEEQLIRTRLRIPGRGDPVKLMNAAGICQLLNGGRVGAGMSSRKVGMTMMKLGFERVHTKSGNYFRVYEVPWDQIQGRLSADAYDMESVSPAPQEPELPF